MTLLPFVDNASLDAEEAVCNAVGQSSADVTDPLMQVDLRTPSGLTSSFHGLLRRKLELSVVYGVLSACVPSLASAESSSASLFATSVADMARSSRQALLDMLARVPAPSRGGVVNFPFSCFLCTFAAMNPNELPAGVAVYCASSSEIDPKYMAVARRTGALLAAAGVPLVCGGGAGGMMAAAIEGCVGASGIAVGVLPQFMMEKKWNHPLLSRTIVTDSMHSRKQTMASMSRGAIALPGGIGTLDELAEIMTWRSARSFSSSRGDCQHRRLLRQSAPPLRRDGLTRLHARRWHPCRCGCRPRRGSSHNSWITLLG